jgi:ornithine cyclodeaminase/alanine dehydrogenase-like protein (mu-crystallin family)
MSAPRRRHEAWSSTSRETLVLTRLDVTSVLGIDDCIDAVEQAFRAHAEGLSVPPEMLGVHVPDGAFHVKAAGLRSSRPVFAAKVNANFPGNPDRYAVPTIQGVVVLFDLETGQPLAILDSTAITSLRTAAATAVAAKYLARSDAGVATVCGCGEQGRSQLRALSRVRKLRTVFAFDAVGDHSERYAREMAQELGLDVRPTDNLRDATLRSEIIITCTTAARYIIDRDQVAPGAFVAGVGADHQHKQELDPALLAASTVVADVVEQCATIGDLHHAIEAGLMTRADVYAELAEIVAGRRVGRRSLDEIMVFDSTGSALQDVAAAALVYQKAVVAGMGIRVVLGAEAR